MKRLIHRAAKEAVRLAHAVQSGNLTRLPSQKKRRMALAVVSSAYQPGSGTDKSKGWGAA